MTAPRQQLTDALSAALGDDVIVQAYADDVDPPARPLLMLRLDEITRPPAGPHHRLYTFGLIVLTPLTETGPADDQLESIVETVLYALDTAEPLGAVIWTAAKRASYRDTYPAFEISLATAATVTQE